MVVGVTGIYCSGKSSVSTVFNRFGFTIIDVDSIGHDALVYRYDEIVKTFGKEIVNNGKIDRRKLGRIVFDNPELKKRLEIIVHPWMIRRVKRLLKDNENNVIDAALLIEMCLFTLCDYVIAVDVKDEIAVQRAVIRNGISVDEARARVASQIPLKEKLHYVDKIIENNGDYDEFIRTVEEIVSNLCKKA